MVSLPTEAVTWMMNSVFVQILYNLSLAAGNIISGSFFTPVFELW